jgi:glycosyltransferase involved in cell wall biosynthesis
MSPRRVTVVIPTHNRADLVGAAIDSVLGQSYRDFELVVYDNASTDETPEVVAAYRDDRLTYVRRPANIGLLQNFQDALQRVETEYTLMLCDDDLLLPGFLDATVGVLDRQPRVGMVHTAFTVLDGKGEVVDEQADWTGGLTKDTVEAAPDFLAESMRWGCRVCSSAALMRTAALPEEPFEQGDFPAIDFGLWLRMALNWDIAYVARPLAAYRIHATSESAGLGVPLAAGYLTGVAWVDQRAGVKARFLAGHGATLPNRAELARLARKGRRFELVMMVRKATLPDRRPLPTLRSLALATRADPRVLADPAAWRLAVASLLGPRVVERIRGRA